MQAFRKALPQHDFLYMGDTQNLPYGPRPADVIHGYTQQCVDYLFQQGCPLVIIACNTASASALRSLQNDYLPKHYPDRRILGVIVPTLEATLATGHHRIGLIGTAFTVNSNIYPNELQKINPQIRLFAKATPLLVALAENEGIRYAEPILRDYLDPLLAENIDSLILGCTHYPLFRPALQKILPPGVDIIGQDEVIPPKLVDYLQRHPEIDQRLGKNGHIRALLTALTPAYRKIGQNLLGEGLEFERVKL